MHMKIDEITVLCCLWLPATSMACKMRFKAFAGLAIATKLGLGWAKQITFKIRADMRQEGQATTTTSGIVTCGKKSL